VDETPAPDENAAPTGPSESELADTTAVSMDVDDADRDGYDDPAPEPEVASGGGVSKTALVVGMLAAALVAGVVGVIIGWKVEQQRVKDDLANIRPVGTVTAVDDDSLTMSLSSASGNRTYVITDATVIDGETGGDTSAVDEGATVLVKSKETGGDLQAVEIVVFPEGTTYGRG
jgi:hypothetical protein